MVTRRWRKPARLRLSSRVPSFFDRSPRNSVESYGICVVSMVRSLKKILLGAEITAKSTSTFMQNALNYLEIAMRGQNYGIPQ
jgi:hypothetical protein